MNVVGSLGSYEHVSTQQQDVSGVSPFGNIGVSHYSNEPYIDVFRSTYSCRTLGLPAESIHSMSETACWFLRILRKREFRKGES